MAKVLFVRYLDSIQAELDTPRCLDEVDQRGFDLVFYPGGHGPMEDLAHDEVSGALLTGRLASGRPLAMLCHGPAALLAAKDADGSWPFAGYRMTALSSTEEKPNSFGRKAPWFLEDRLRESGADFTKGKIPLVPHLETDRNLCTGQNPASSERLARRLVTDLG
ncbi:DJ-1/PfpI family protein [Nonomuraea sp. NPDC050310]|uniref:DJ-1/PfpI family protein n=1 Tax=Nonomuraea sp. NPDC050310 TaxID=3154935 RepID=UPI0033E3C69E